MGRYIPTYIPTTTPPERRIDLQTRGEASKLPELPCPVCALHTHTLPPNQKTGGFEAEEEGRGREQAKPPRRERGEQSKTTTVRQYRKLGIRQEKMKQK